MAKTVLIELFTLDSAGCAPCTYLKEMVDNASGSIDGIVEIVEHKIKNKEAVKLMKSRGVTSIPTVCIGGDIVYESLLPSEEELIDEINKRLK